MVLSVVPEGRSASKSALWFDYLIMSGGLASILGSVLKHEPRPSNPLILG